MGGVGVLPRAAGTGRACSAIAIQIAATNAISIGFGQQVGDWKCGAGNGLDYPRVGVVVKCLPDSSATRQPYFYAPSSPHPRRRRLSHKLQFPFVSHHSYVLFE